MLGWSVTVPRNYADYHTVTFTSNASSSVLGETSYSSVTFISNVSSLVLVWKKHSVVTNEYIHKQWTICTVYLILGPAPISNKILGCLLGRQVEHQFYNE